jgi:hypothetical protein
MVALTNDTTMYLCVASAGSVLTAHTALGCPGSSDTAISATARPWRSTRSEERGPRPHSCAAAFPSATARGARKPRGRAHRVDLRSLFAREVADLDVHDGRQALHLRDEGGQTCRQRCPAHTHTHTHKRPQARHLVDEEQVLERARREVLVVVRRRATVGLNVILAQRLELEQVVIAELGGAEEEALCVCACNRSAPLPRHRLLPPAPQHAPSSAHTWRHRAGRCRSTAR